MSLIEKIDELERHLVKNNCYFEGAEWLFGKAREAILSQQKEPIGNTEQLKEIIKKIDEEIAMYQQRIDNRNGACYHDESERLIRFEERLHEAERIKEIILSEQKEPCKGCQHDGEYENEVEYGYPSPCAQCKRRCSDNHLNQSCTE